MCLSVCLSDTGPWKCQLKATVTRANGGSTGLMGGEKQVENEREEEKRKINCSIRSLTTTSGAVGGRTGGQVDSWTGGI